MSNTEFPKMAISFNFIFGFQIVDVTVKGDNSFEVEIYIMVHNPLLVRRKQSTRTTAYMYQKKNTTKWWGNFENYYFLHQRQREVKN